MGFGEGLTYPIPKGHITGKRIETKDFRGITISPLISKLFEKFLLTEFNRYFYSADNQFGFKPKLGCSHAIYCFKSVINYYVDNCSTVNVCTLDLSKAFDKINDSLLLLKLMNRGLPNNVILLLHHWFEISVSSVSWYGSLSKPFTVSAGVRQGGVLSPLLFASYVDVVIEKTISHGDGCHVGVHNMSIFMYADDLVLLSPSVCQLQRMINVVAGEIADLDMTVNTDKSYCVSFGKRHNNEKICLTLNGTDLVWKKELKYLGILFVASKKLSIGLKNCKSAFYKSFNAIYSKIFKSNENLILTLVNTYCIPALYYGLEAVDLNLSDADSLDQPIMRALGKVFKTYDRSVLHWCMFYFGYMPAQSALALKKIKFLSKLKLCNNMCVYTLTNICIMQDLDKIVSKFEIDVNDHFRSIKNKLLFDFGSTLSLS